LQGFLIGFCFFSKGALKVGFFKAKMDSLQVKKGFDKLMAYHFLLIYGAGIGRN
jgi:hypothetical protein